MAPTVVIVLIVLFIGIGGIVARLLKLKKEAESPTRKIIDKLDKESYPEVTQKYKLEDLSKLRAHWRNNGLEFSDPQFEELYTISVQDENGNFSVSKRSMDLNLIFHGNAEQVYIIIDCYYNLGNIMHVHSKNPQLLDSFDKAFKQSNQRDSN